MKDNKCVHLDFHTSELIEGVGALFDEEQFISSIKTAGIDSITVFAKCHHGCFYYEDTKFFKHPYLCTSLLDRQIEACKKAGVSSKIYISAGFDEHTAKGNPQWLIKDKDGNSQTSSKFRRLCFNTPYLDLLKSQTEEVVKKYMPDGVFLDIVADAPCYCEYCLADMKKKGLNPDSEDDVKKQAKDVFNLYVNEINKLVKSIKPDCLIFHNAGDFPVGREDRLDCCDQLETESLPTAFWGYDHFPLSMSYIRRKNKNCIGMTGKFHKSWGEFGSFKYEDALRYEASQCLALNAGFSVGDQLHPSGEIDAYTYENIGKANAYTKERENFRGGEFLAEMAVYSLDKATTGRTGISRILFEEKILFDLIDESEISNKYKLIVLSDDKELNASEYSKFSQYVKEGGKLLCACKNNLYEGKTAFDLGCEILGQDDQIPCFIKAKYPLKYANAMPLAVFENAYKVKATGEVLADKLSPYFVREGERFCSHRYTPYDPSKTSSIITKGNDGIYLASDLFSQYAKDGSLTAKQIIAPLLQMLLEEKTIITDLPSSGKVALYRKDDSFICHLWYANTIKRGDGVEVIEDIVTLSKVNVSIKISGKVESVTARPSGEKIDFTRDGDRVNFVLKDFNCYQIIEIK